MTEYQTTIDYTNILDKEIKNVSSYIFSTLQEPFRANSNARGFENTVGEGKMNVIGIRNFLTTHTDSPANLKFKFG